MKIKWKEITGSLGNEMIAEVRFNQNAFDVSIVLTSRPDSCGSLMGGRAVNELAPLRPTF